MKASVDLSLLSNKSRSVVLTVSCFLLLIPTLMFAASLEGIVVDKSNGAPVENVNITLENTTYGASTDFSGFWRLRHLLEGTYTLQASHVSYADFEMEISVSQGEATVNEIELEPHFVSSEGVIVTFDRVESATSPVPLTNVDHAEIQERYYGQDLPVALEGVPSLTTVTDAGNALGYSYLSMRGFDFKRIGVFLNGVMLNEPEDFYVYWVDLADFGASVEDVQVQRGVGSVPYGLPSVGGTISVNTRTTSLTPEITAEYGQGSYNTQRSSFHFSSGPVYGRNYIDTRFSRITSDGYRRESWADYFSYYLSAAHLGDRTSTRLVVFGGPIKNHMAYAGVTRDELEQDRRANPLTYDDETDNFYQPHYQLHHSWMINDDMRLDNTLYLIQGDGYFNVSYPSYWGYTWDFWDLSQLTVADSTLYPAGWYRTNEDGSFAQNGDGDFYVDYMDAVVRQHVVNTQAGWQPRLHWTVGDHELAFGGQVVSHRSRRYGEIIWAAALPQGTEPNHKWYDYQGRKLMINGFVRDQWSPSDRFTVTGALQLASITYKVLNDKRFGTEFDQDYLFAMPYFGVSYRASRPLRLYSSYSLVQREPRLKDHYWGETGYPVLRYDDPANFEDPQVKPEVLHDIEIGADWTHERIAVHANVYWMEMYDEIVDIGEYDVLGQPVIENADHSRRVGLELGARAALPRDFYVEGNLNIARNRFVDFQTTTSIADANYYAFSIDIDNSENHIIKAPEQIINIAAGWRGAFGWARLSAHHVGKQYLDNTEDLRAVDMTNPDIVSSPSLGQDRFLDAYTRVDFSAGINLFGKTPYSALVTRNDLPLVEVELYVRNLFDAEYELTGSSDAWGVYVIPAAPRHYMLGVKVTL